MPKKNKFSVLILLIAIGMIAFGMCRGEVGTVLTKAVNLCLECVGIG